MAFGGLKGTLVGGNNSIPNPLPATGSVSVAVGDLVVAVIGQQTALTVTAVTDNLGNTYTAQNAGTLSGTTISGRMFYSRVTVAGTLTTVNAAATASANDATIAVAVFEGLFESPPIDTNPANATNDVTTPYTSPASGTLAQAVELVVSWMTFNSTSVLSATSPNLKAVQNSQSANADVVIGYQVTAATTTVTPAWTGTAPTANVLGTASFKQPIRVNVTGAAGTGTAGTIVAKVEKTPGQAAGIGVAGWMAGQGLLDENSALILDENSLAIEDGVSGYAWVQKPVTQAAGTGTAGTVTTTSGGGGGSGTLTMAAGTGVANSIVAEVDKPLGQAAGTGVANGITPSVAVLVVGASGTGTAGTNRGAVDKPVTGAAGIGVANGIVSSVAAFIAMASGTGTANAVTAGPAKNVTGVAGTGVANSGIVPNVFAFLSMAAGTGAVGAITFGGSSSVNVSGVAGTGVANGITPSVTAFLAMAAGTGSAGTTSGADTEAPSGVAGTGTAGTVRALIEKTLAQAAGVGTANGITTSLAASMLAAIGIGTAGTTRGADSTSSSGVTGAGTAGTVRALIEKALTGASGVGVAGSFQAPTFTGVAGIGVAGLFTPAGSYILDENGLPILDENNLPILDETGAGPGYPWVQAFLQGAAGGGVAHSGLIAVNVPGAAGIGVANGIVPSVTAFIDGGAAGVGVAHGFLVDNSTTASGTLGRAFGIGVAGRIGVVISGGGVSRKKPKTGFEPVVKLPPQQTKPTKPKVWTPPQEYVRSPAIAPQSKPVPLVDPALVPTGLLGIMEQMRAAEDLSDVNRYLEQLDQDEQDAADIADVLALLDD